MAGNSPERKKSFFKRKESRKQNKEWNNNRNLILTALEILQYENTITSEQMDKILKQHGFLRDDQN